jgi:hypothetical protein
MNMGPEFDDYINGIREELIKLGVDPRVASYFLRKYYFRIKTAFYEDQNPQQIIDLMKKKIYESIEKEGLITEGRKMDEVTRTVVRDILNVIKKGPGSYYLPEELVGDDMFYVFPNLPEFTIEITVKEDLAIKSDYLITSQTADDGDVIEMMVIKHPQKFPEAYYDLVADLNDNVRHELEHVLQEFGLRDVRNPHDGDTPTDKEYYKQAHEVPAEIAGFRRIVKLRRQKPEEVIRDWFYRNSEVHGLSNDDIEELVDFLTKQYKKIYG